jgi:hypothetical protein
MNCMAIFFFTLINQGKSYLKQNQKKNTDLNWVDLIFG